jgi:hypothetical protein
VRKDLLSGLPRPFERHTVVAQRGQGAGVHSAEWNKRAARRALPTGCGLTSNWQGDRLANRCRLAFSAVGCNVGTAERPRMSCAVAAFERGGRRLRYVSLSPVGGRISRTGLSALRPRACPTGWYRGVPIRRRVHIWNVALYGSSPGYDSLRRVTSSWGVEPQ